MKYDKRKLNMVTLLLAIALVFGYAMPAFAQETPGGASIGKSSTGDDSPALSLTATPASIGATGDITIDETNFPDANFRAWLTNSVNIGGAGSDSVLTPEEITGITQIYMDRQGIRNLAGIELFTSLTALMCAYNYNSFTVANGFPDSLTHLFFMGSDLTTLPDLPSGLLALNCSDNKLAKLPPLPVTLTALDCSNNALTALDISWLDSLNLSGGFNASVQNTYIALLSDGAGGFEMAIELNNPTFGSPGISYEGGKLKSNNNTITETTFTVETGKVGATLSGTLQLSYPAVGSIAINATNFPDANFRAILKSPDIWIGIRGVGKDGYLTPDEIAGITSLDLNNQGIRDFTGIAFFTALETFNCGQNALVALPTLPDSLNVLLCVNNNLTTLPPLPSGLERLYCSNNKLTVLPALPDGLIGLDCSYNPFTAPPTLPGGLEWLTYSGLGSALLPPLLPATLTELDYSDNGLTSLNLAGLTSLYRLNCSDNSITELNVSGLGSLYDLDCSGNRLTELNVSGLDDLEELNCAGNLVTTLDVSSLDALEELNCAANWLTALNVSGLDFLYNLNCTGNSLTTLDVSSLDALEELDCSGNLLTALDLNGLSSLYELNCSSNHLTALDLSNFSTAGYFDLQADDQTPRLSLLGSDSAGYSAVISLNNPSGWAAGFSYAGGILKSTNRAVTSTPFSVDTGLAGGRLSGTMLLTYGDGSSGTTHTIIALAGSGGSVSPRGDVSVTAGASQTFTITPNAHYRISSVTVDGVDQGAITSYTFTNVIANHSINASFSYMGSSGGEASYTPRTLIDNSTGITVSGSGIPSNAVLTITDMDLHAPGADNACDAIRQRIAEGDSTLILGRNVSLSPSFSGKLTIAVPVGTQYNGQIVTVLHCKKGILETLTATVANGRATFTVTSLSPLAVFIYDPSVPNNIPKTGDISLNLLGWLLCGTSAVSIVILVRTKKKGFPK